MTSQELLRITVALDGYANLFKSIASDLREGKRVDVAELRLALVGLVADFLKVILPEVKS